MPFYGIEHERKMKLDEKITSAHLDIERRFVKTIEKTHAEYMKNKKALEYDRLVKINEKNIARDLIVYNHSKAILELKFKYDSAILDTCMKQRYQRMGFSVYVSEEQNHVSEKTPLIHPPHDFAPDIAVWNEIMADMGKGNQDVIIAYNTYLIRMSKEPIVIDLEKFEAMGRAKYD